MRGDSSSASAWTFVPKVDVGVAPYEGCCNKPKGSVVPKVDVEVAPCEETATKSKESVAQPPDQQDTKHKAATQTVGTHTPTDTTDTVSWQQWSAT